MSNTRAPVVQVKKPGFVKGAWDWIWHGEGHFFLRTLFALGPVDMADDVTGIGVGDDPLLVIWGVVVIMAIGKINKHRNLMAGLP